MEVTENKSTQNQSGLTLHFLRDDSCRRQLQVSDEWGKCVVLTIVAQQLWCRFIFFTDQTLWITTMTWMICQAHIFLRKIYTQQQNWRVIQHFLSHTLTALHSQIKITLHGTNRCTLSHSAAMHFPKQQIFTQQFLLALRILTHCFYITI